MTENVLQFWPEMFMIIGWGVALVLFAVTLGMAHRPSKRPGCHGHRPEEQCGEYESIRPDGFIDSFAGEIEEAGGGLLPVLKLVLPGILLWWLLYLILNWTPK
jgi:hypothetical protein